ncbi:MAG TPA: transposase [Mycobacteriales bacterium]|nr:transposase [Mycobacteriales bacterium]
MIEPKVVVGGLHEDAGAVEGIGALCRFRWQFYSCLSGRADAVFELTDALLCSDGPVRSLVDLALAPEHRRGHGARYDGFNRGLIEIARLRRTLAQLPLPRVGGRIVLAVDVSPWLRPDALTCPQRLFCHAYGRGKGNAQLVPGWPYSDDATAVTTAQVREVVQRLRQAGHWHPGDPDILIVMDSGYDVTRLAFVLADLPAAAVLLIGRLRSDRVMLLPAPERQPGTNGRPPATARSLPALSRPPGPPRRGLPPLTPAVTAPPGPPAGSGCTRG